MRLAQHPLINALVGLAYCLLLSACAGGLGPEDITTDSDSEGFRQGKADSAGAARGPITTIRCHAAESFVRRGSYGALTVEARDEGDRLSKNYEIRVEPTTGHRLVQRDTIIFDQDGSYTIRCCALDSDVCDELGIQVGELDPALSVFAPSFETATEAVLEGRALQRGEAPAKVTINGTTVVVDAEGRFSHSVPIQSGMNRFELVAVGDDGRSSTRHAWTIGGPFRPVAGQEQAQGRALQIYLGQEAYPQLAAIAKSLTLREIAELSDSDGFRAHQEGIKLGYQWVVKPKSLTVSEVDIRFTQGSSADQLTLNASFPKMVFLSNAETRFGSGEWRQRTLEATSEFEVELTIGVREGTLVVDDVRVDLGSFNLEISDFPSFFEGILEFFLRGTVKNAVRDSMSKGARKSLSTIAEGFRISKSVSLPKPLHGELGLEANLTSYQLWNGGLQIELDLAATGVPEPERKDAPGPCWTSATLSPSMMESAYEVQFHLNHLNGLVFEAWRSGGLNFMIIDDQPTGENEDGLFTSDRLTLFMNPLLPPIISLGAQPGELVIELGAMQIDGVLESELGNWNSSVLAGGKTRALLHVDAQTLELTLTTEYLDADVLIAPAGLEKEATRRLLERVIAEQVIPGLLNLLKIVQIPSADLSSLRLPGVTRLSPEQLKVSWSNENTLSLTATVRLD